MVQDPTFAGHLVAQLGRPTEPFGVDDVMALVALAAAAAAYLALELGFARLLGSILRLLNGEKP